MENRSYDVAIIGGGPGGYSSALYCARAGYSVVVIERLSPGGQMATTETIDNYPGFEDGVDGFDLGEKMRRGAEKFGAVTLFEEVNSVSLVENPKKLECSGGPVSARAVIISTGAEPKKLGIEAEESLAGRGVAYCATCDGMFYKNKAVAVAGGGNSAVEDAIYLTKLCKKVYLLHRRDTLRASRVYFNQLKDSGVEFVPNVRVERLIHGEKLTAVKLADVNTGEERELAVDGLFIAIGRKPQTELFKGQLNITSDGYIEADETTRTNLPGVFAAGDVRTKALRQVVTAAADGAVAAHFVEEFLG